MKEKEKNVKKLKSQLNENEVGPHIKKKEKNVRSRSRKKTRE